MGERLKYLRKCLGLTQQEFAERIGIKRNTLANYEVGRNEPIDAVFKLICDCFGVNEQWLRSGEGEMFAEVSQEDDLYRMVDEMLRDKSAEMKRRLVSAILRLSPEQIRTGVDWMIETFGLEEAAPAADHREPTIDEKVASYRAELEAAESSRKLEASQTGSGKEA